ncbi:hypothetical protein [Loktanella sp. SALINAS62]|uniref:hypothetical protein n=1 Tax=Loktanella sp. SALINAS62 TaxID=2706124 RepID=UPI001B8BD7A7|nr:hypothetical protein [Loktanella sp. SALINAS62]MBS1303458.1 hypothetical protein [Loktanella sp. SALINAS62]
MFEWIAQHSELLNVLLNGLMVVIWVAYLQIFLVSFRRQQRTDIIINMGAGSGLEARCFVSNLGLEPLYLHDVLVELTTSGGTYTAVITDRANLTDEQLNRPSEATNQGPLRSGDYIDIGSFSDLLERASDSLQDVNCSDVTHIKITAVAKTSSSSHIVGAFRDYQLHKSGSRTKVRPTQIGATQIRSWWHRRTLRKEMSRRLIER